MSGNFDAINASSADGFEAGSFVRLRFFRGHFQVRFLCGWLSCSYTYARFLSMTQPKVQKSKSAIAAKVPACVAQQLGMRSDRDLEAEFGISAYYLRRQREALGIPAFKVNEFPDEMIALLGSVTDREICIRFDAHPSSVFRLRETLGIPRHRKSVGNKSFQFPEIALSYLGRMSDRDLAKKYNLPLKKVINKRGALRIKAFKPVLVPEAIALLGQVPDLEIALRFNVPVSVVLKTRRSLGIYMVGRVWSPEEIEMLGMMTDKCISETCNISIGVVSHKRLSLGIAAYVQPAWTLEYTALLGTIPDKKLSALSGISIAAVARKRSRQSIPSCNVSVRPFSTRSVCAVSNSDHCRDNTKALYEVCNS